MRWAGPISGGAILSLSYRVTVNQGTERRYSFTILCSPGDYDALRSGYEAITVFLDGDRNPERHEVE